MLKDECGMLKKAAPRGVFRSSVSAFRIYPSAFAGRSGRSWTGGYRWQILREADALDAACGGL
jgi:hypothetical protein